MEHERHVPLLRDSGLPTPPSTPQRPKHELRVRSNLNHPYLETPPGTPPLAKGRHDNVQLQDSPCSTNLTSDGPFGLAPRGSKPRAVSGASENAPPGNSITVEKKVDLSNSLPSQIACSLGFGPSNSSDDSSDGSVPDNDLTATPYRPLSPPNSNQLWRPPSPRSLASLDGESSCQTHEDDREDPDFVPEDIPSPAPRSSCPSPTRVSSLNNRLRPKQSPRKITASCSSPTKSLDRFIAPRAEQSSCKDRLELTRPAAALTPLERAMRRRTGLSDPFAPSTRNLGRPSEQTTNISHRPIMQPSRIRTTESEVLTPRSDSTSNLFHQGSAGTAWTFGVLDTGHALESGNVPTSGPSSGGESGVPRYTSRFLQDFSPEADMDLWDRRLALALDVDLTNRVVPLAPETPPAGQGAGHGGQRDVLGRYVWRDNEWAREGPVRLLEAPNLRDDYYCSILAYSRTADRLAVGLGNKVYMWSQKTGVSNPPADINPTAFRTAYVTSLAFSSAKGGHGILAVSRSNGSVLLWSPGDEEKRLLRIAMPTAAVIVSFRPTTEKRPSQRLIDCDVEQEVLLVGDDLGTVNIYFVEWPKQTERFLFGWEGGVALHARVCVHTQQICGIAWSPDGEYFATGGNDNLCCLFETRKVLGSQPSPVPMMELRRDALGNSYVNVSPATETEVVIRSSGVKHQWRLNAAVKAIAFCPWQKGLLACGGGSNDRGIHFCHTFSGARLAIIDCAAQITSLIWSSTRREIAATFGFAQPEHPYRIAVYTWPSCEQVVAIPWHDEMRALYAIPYPGGPTNGRSKREGKAWWPSTVKEGSIVVAGSDGSIKFHEVWCEARQAVGSRSGLLGGSEIIEKMHGIDKDDNRDVIR